MKKIIFLLIASVLMSQTFAQTITLRPPTVGSTSATINGQVSGVVSSATAFSVIYGESATNLNKTKKTNVTFGPGVLLLSGFTLGTDLDSLKQLTKYYYKYAVNDAFTGVINRLTVLDSFTTTKIPFVFSLETSNLNDTAKKNSFVSKLTSNDVTKPVYKIVNNTGSVDGNLFAIKNDSLFTSATLDTISNLTYSFSIQATFSDATTKSNNITIKVVDKTPPIIRLKSDSLLLFFAYTYKVGATPVAPHPREHLFPDLNCFVSSYFSLRCLRLNSLNFSYYLYIDRNWILWTTTLYCSASRYFSCTHC